ncbi:hypothetical protein CIRG_06714 [Coccidioides immitis RMSCC 2394]|uniref:Uncharacterized protein n=1 Tax=Coccidioides immitis RMSCC 2394 TaxID=404692 RepID=A0A0J6YJE8_COCIT|nr:hypothetical protein CIRG_06714 [Coccidioides immitis RMSCC 2394]
MGEQDTSEERKIFASCANRKPLSNGGGKLANPTVSGGRKHKWDEVLKQWSGKTAGDLSNAGARYCNAGAPEMRRSRHAFGSSNLSTSKLRPWGRSWDWTDHSLQLPQTKRLGSCHSFGAKRNTGTTSSQTVTTARIAKVANSGARSNAFLDDTSNVFPPPDLTLFCLSIRCYPAVSLEFARRVEIDFGAMPPT